MATYFRGFEEADGISDWTEVAIASGHTAPAWSIVNTDEVQATSTHNQNEALVWNDIDGDADSDDVEILFQSYVNSTTASQRVGAVRISTSGASRTCYYVTARSSGFAIGRMIGATTTTIASNSVTRTSDAWYWIRFRVNLSGNTIQARIWADGDSEPGTWGLDSTDSTYTNAGHVGLLKGANTNTQKWRKFGVGTNGDTAPASAPSSGVNGSLSKTLAGATVSAAGTLPISGATSTALAGATASASGALAVNGQLAVSLGGATLSAAGTIAAAGINGTLSATLGGATLSAAAELALSGAASVTLTGATVAAAGSGQQITTGALTATLDGAAASAAGSLALRAQLARTLDGATVSSGGHVDITAALGVTLDGASIVAAGGAPGATISGSLNRTLAGATLSALGSETAEPDASPGYTITGRLRAFEIRGRARRFEVDQ